MIINPTFYKHRYYSQFSLLGHILWQTGRHNSSRVDTCREQLKNVEFLPSWGFLVTLMASRCRYSVLWLVLKRNHLKNFWEERVILTNSKSKKCRTITEIKEKLNIIYFFILFLTFTGHLETLFIDLGGMKVLQVSIAYTPCFPTPSLEWLVSFSSPYKQLSAR